MRLDPREQASVGHLEFRLGSEDYCAHSDKKTTTFDIMDDAPPLEKLKEKRVNATKPVGPIMGRGMLWKSSESPVAKRARIMTSELNVAKIIAKKKSADLINEFVDNIPDDGDEIRGAARINRLLLEIRALVRKHQVENRLVKFFQIYFSSHTRPQNSRFQGFKNNCPLGNILSVHRNPRNIIFKMSTKKSLLTFISTR